jgi:hypothetical protein
MNRIRLLPALAIASLFAASEPAAAATPVRCEAFISAALVSQNVPMECTRPDGSTFVNVPADYYLFVTDILVKPRLTTQPAVGASVRIWKESGGGGTGCSAAGDAVTGSFVTDQYLELADTAAQGQLHVPYRVPFLVLTPNDCLAVYVSTSGGAIVELTALLSTSPNFGLLALPEPDGAVVAGVPAATLAVIASRRRGRS